MPVHPHFLLMCMKEANYITGFLYLTHNKRRPLSMFVHYFLFLYISGWFWSGTGISIAPTNATARGWLRNPWSRTGYIGQFLGKTNQDQSNKGRSEMCNAQSKSRNKIVASLVQPFFAEALLTSSRILFFERLVFFFAKKCKNKKKKRNAGLWPNKWLITGRNSTLRQTHGHFPEEINEKPRTNVI